MDNDSLRKIADDIRAVPRTVGGLGDWEQLQDYAARLDAIGAWLRTLADRVQAGYAAAEGQTLRSIAGETEKGGTES